MPQFSGKYLDWPAFRDLFHSVVVSNGAVSDVEKLHYLKTCVRGDAEQLIKNLAITSDNFNRAWAVLTRHYENTRVLVSAFFNSFLAIPKMKSDSVADLRRIFHGMLSTVGSLEGVRRPICSCAPTS
ncbi:uncharacterized protein LOC112589864 [Harpegnathos saltator]|uniref:uncharacterized protein LOC112589864 n=1 Tax=Harpegnathos saltator TaxID=610380 RepID=UPI000DBEDC4E|nr:uncharacterized protein LOC112589864 [Harpegnathos saltator]